ncbi:MAG: penicillin-binding protein 2 [Endomicrobium sp.]|jgi:penicillin-binding protein 2|nr:penicillin-binding protein 2 [Endomicrobium sp.]
MVWQKEDKFSYEIFIEKHKTVFIFFVTLFVCLFVRLFYLQIVKGDRYRKISDRQRMHNTYERAARGIIYSKDNNTVLVGNKFVFIVLFYPFKQSRFPSDKSIKDLNKILGKDVKFMIDMSYKCGKIIKLADNLTLEEMFKIREKKLNLNGISVLKKSRRVYYYPEATSHITGYAGEIGPNEIKKSLKHDYKIGDYIGKAGIEKVYDKYLRGKDGGWQIEMNVRGRQLKGYKYVQPKIGANVYSTINLKLQKVAYEALRNSSTGRGAVVVLDVKTGAVKALVSCPGFDANKVGTRDFNKYLKDKKLSLFNRTIQAFYPPGSIFKIITFVAAVELLNINPEKTIQCEGSFKLGNRRYSCWCKQGHNKISLFSAMVHSCNVYFYKLGLRVGAANLKKYARKFHLGQKMEIDLPNEKKGFIPTPEWKKTKLKARWLHGDTVIFSIGQGALWVTPLQMACMMSAVANKGICHKPYVVDKIVSLSGDKIYSHKLNYEEKIDLSDGTWDLLHKSLLEVVESGTGIRSKIPGIKIAGKTGTAQNLHGYDHAWFVSYAPAENPEIAMAVIIENGGGGGYNAVPVGKKIYESYFNMKSEEIVKR